MTKFLWVECWSKRCTVDVGLIFLLMEVAQTELSLLEANT